MHALAGGARAADTEELRKAMLAARGLFETLVGARSTDRTAPARALAGRLRVAWPGAGKRAAS
ncbi:hypothetical protein SRB5_49040 [Streptomyces sp. RB5]|uniref:Uncharacterized protein n=1 Tax=Streptomyces smaragdinus TaxID=2585196 RepID=A0A7K0CMM6_9ACTN|nr:hypothetical protein [Streptomyces smaragdinus]MQY14728.1 hypothetical protein [Streptomyces smaragdinus]